MSKFSSDIVDPRDSNGRKESDIYEEYVPIYDR